MKRKRVDAKPATTRPPSKRACVAQRAGQQTDWLDAMDKRVRTEVDSKTRKVEPLEGARQRTSDLLKQGYVAPKHAGQMTDSQSFSYKYDKKTKLFDFQEAAVKTCLQQLTKHRAGVLALGTGLGKSHVMATIIKRSKQKQGVLVLTMGGLVRQLTRSLQKHAGRDMASAETGEQLSKALARNSPLLVANGALRRGENSIHKVILKHKGLIIIDEAHLVGQQAIVRAAGQRSEGQLLLVTATPEMCVWLSRRPERRCDVLRSQVVQVPWAKDSEKDETLLASLVPSSICFRIEKTEHVMRSLGLPMPKLKVIEAEIQDREVYYQMVFRHIVNVTSIPPFLFAPLTWRPSAMDIGKALRCGLSLLPHVPDEYRKQLIDHLRPLAGTSESLHLTEAQQQRCKELFGVAPGAATSGNIGLCQASGLRDQDCRALQSWSKDALEAAVVNNSYNSMQSSYFGGSVWGFQPPAPASQPLWASTSLRGWTSVLVRYSDKKEIQNVMSNYPLPADVLPFVLTNDMSAGQRARLIDRFASRDGQYAALRVLQRGFAAEPTTSVKHKVGRLGMGRYFAKTLESFLARPRVLIADETVSVGFDLHRHIDQIFIAEPPTSRHDFVQLLGRVSRIAVDQQEQPPIEVACTVGPCAMPVLQHITVDEHAAGSMNKPMEMKGFIHASDLEWERSGCAQHL